MTTAPYDDQINNTMFASVPEDCVLLDFIGSEWVTWEFKNWWAVSGRKLFREWVTSQDEARPADNHPEIADVWKAEIQRAFEPLVTRLAVVSARP